MPLDPDAHVEIAPADPSWRLRFTKLQHAFSAALSGLAVSVEHVGSTAVPELDAKPILDVAILSDDAATLQAARGRLEAIGYRSDGDRGVPGRESFRRAGPDVPTNEPGPWMDHHLYLALATSDYADVQKRFLEYLRRHPDTARRYATLKHSLARAFGHDREAYTERKGVFIRALLAAEAIERRTGVAGAAREDSGSVQREHEIEYETFASIDVRVGTVVAARSLPKARRPAIVMEIDLGPVGLLASSAQVTDLYAPDELLGRQVIAVVNFPPKQIGSVISRCLVLGAMTPDAVVLLAPDRAVANGTRVL